ncbi:MAG: hypothetical protein V5A40_16485 [Haloarculaceae archaeon]
MSDSAGGSTGGGWDVLFEETLSVRDEGGAGRLIGFTHLSVGFLIVYTLVSTVLVVTVAASMFTSAVGGIDVALSIVDGVRSERPAVFAGVLLVGVVTVGVGLLLVVGFVRRTRRAFDRRVHVRVTEEEVTVERDGTRYWQPSGVEIPFGDVTAVEYPDPDESSLRIELGDWRAPKFFAGRSRSWVRIERGNGPAVYVGSDRPVELAETVARNAPGVERVEPF